MCRSEPSATEVPRPLRDRLERLLGTGSAAEGTDERRPRGAGLAEAGDEFVLGPEFEVGDPEPAGGDREPSLSVRRDDKVVAMHSGRRLGDPLADYIDLWLALERFHERASLTEDGWRCLTEDLQRPLELRLAERRPVTVEGALKALGLARYLMENLDAGDNGGAGDWYRRLRNHLIESAHVALQDSLLPSNLSESRENAVHAQRADHAKR